MRMLQPNYRKTPAGAAAEWVSRPGKESHSRQVTFKADFEGQERFIRDRRRRAFRVVEERHEAVREEGPPVQSPHSIS